MEHWVFPVVSAYVSGFALLYVSGLLSLSMGIIVPLVIGVVFPFVVEWFDLFVLATVVGALAGVFWKMSNWGFR